MPQVYEGHKLEARQHLKDAGLYPTAESMADWGTEEQRAEHTLAIVRMLPFVEAPDLYALLLLFHILTPGSPCFSGHQICFLEGEVHEPAPVRAKDPAEYGRAWELFRAMPIERLASLLPKMERIDAELRAS